MSEESRSKSVEAFRNGYRHGRRDAIVMTPFYKNIGLWLPIGFLIGYFIGVSW